MEEWYRPSIPALGRRRQVDLCKFEANLGYRMSSRKGSKATQRDLVSKKEKRKEKEKKKKEKQNSAYKSRDGQTGGLCL